MPDQTATVAAVRVTLAVHGRYADSAARFAQDTEKHALTVLHDEGLYRHLRFKAPGTSIYWFDLVTWPGYLSFTGDMDGYTFTREEDMFTFFRGRHGINPGYWSEKVVDGRDRVRTWSEKKFRELVEDEVSEAAERWPGLREAVQEELFAETEYEDEALRAARDFQFRTDEGQRFIDVAERALAAALKELKDPNGGRATTSAAAWAKFRRVETEHTFQFNVTSDWDVQDYNWSFLWACHAIQWGIAQYDASRAAADAQVTA